MAAEHKVTIMKLHGWSIKKHIEEVQRKHLEDSHQKLKKSREKFEKSLTDSLEFFRQKKLDSWLHKKFGVNSKYLEEIDPEVVSKVFDCYTRVDVLDTLKGSTNIAASMMHDDVTGDQWYSPVMDHLYDSKNQKNEIAKAYWAEAKELDLLKEAALHGTDVSEFFVPVSHPFFRYLPESDKRE